MEVRNIKRIEVNWMEGWGNDPHLTFVLKRDCVLTPESEFRYRQYGRLFYAVHANEVRFVMHDPNDHNGFGGHRYDLRMAEDWDATQFHGCQRTEPQWDSGGGSMTAKCWQDTNEHGVRVVHLTGPWSSGASVVSKCIGQPVISVGTLTGPNRETVRNLEWYHRRKRQGRAYLGTAYATKYTLEFVQLAIDALAPHLELYEGDYGWYPVRKGDKPKNPRRRMDRKPFDPYRSDEQSRAVEF